MAGRRERQERGGFAVRLRSVVEAHGSANGIAKAIDRSEGAVRKWLRGESEPNVTDLRSLCEETRTSIEWLVTGRGRREAPDSGLQEPATPPYRGSGQDSLDYPLLEAIMEAVDVELRNAGLDLPSTKKSMLVVTLYDMCHARKEVDRDAVARLVRLAG
jgi:transcriptional regulator with XRE-family HTH domain